jgi:hypothetical protein
MKNQNYLRPMKVAVAPGSEASKAYYAVAGLPGAKGRVEQPVSKDRVAGIGATPRQNLIYRGGKTIRTLTYTNFYIGGKNSWDENDIINIDWALEQALKDRYLNNVMRQYFDNKRITATFKPSQILENNKPKKFTQDDAIALVKSLYQNGTLKGFAYANTVLNFMLPKGTVLTDDKSETEKEKNKSRKTPVEIEEEASSLEGLGGYHGSVHVTNSVTISYAIGVYSYRMSNGNDNGIVAFDESWKNIVATFYHELCEARTDSDVDDAIENNNVKYCGWISKAGAECGDYPMEEVGGNLSLIMQEVALANKKGTVPVQFQYSNAVSGPEGPIKSLHKLS